MCLNGEFFDPMGWQVITNPILLPRRDVHRVPKVGESRINPIPRVHAPQWRTWLLGLSPDRRTNRRRMTDAR